jgi:hypothetical protein
VGPGRLHQRGDIGYRIDAVCILLSLAGGGRKKHECDRGGDV